MPVAPACPGDPRRQGPEL